MIQSPNELQTKSSVSFQGNERPGVTVVICCYSHPNYFGETFDSVLQQTSKDVEIIIHNNGANEAYSASIDKAAHDHNIRVISNHPNTYGLAIRSLVLPEVKTKYLAILHDDDVYLPEKLELCVEALERTKKDYLVTNYFLMDANGAPWAEKNESVNTRRFRGRETRGRLLAEMLRAPGCSLHYSTLVMRTDLAQRTMIGDPFWPRIADCLMWADLLIDPAIQGIILTQELSKVRIHGENDRLYDKFEPDVLLKQRVLLALSEMELTRRIIERAPDEILISFLEEYVGVPRGNDAVQGLIEAAAMLDENSAGLWGPRKIFVPMLFHAAFARDARRAVTLLEEAACVDANSFMSRNYNRAAESIISLGKSSRRPKKPSTMRHLRRHPAKVAPHIYLWLKTKLGAPATEEAPVLSFPPTSKCAEISIT